MNTNIVKKNNFTKITISLLIIAAGIIITIFNFPYAKLIGILLFFGGVITLSLCRKTLVHGASGSRITSHTFFFPAIKKDEIRLICHNGDFKKFNKLSKSEQGLQMDVYLSEDGNYSAIQLYEYIPYKYERCSPLFEYKGEQSQNLVSYIRTLSV